jgi:hypothetical protein
MALQTGRSVAGGAGSWRCRRRRGIGVTGAGGGTSAGGVAGVKATEPNPRLAPKCGVYRTGMPIMFLRTGFRGVPKTVGSLVR